MYGNLRLAHLLELADKGPALRAALVEELADLLTFWPSDCPQNMRVPCEALLTRAAREVDETARAALRLRLSIDPALAARVLPSANLAPTLIEMARAGMDIRARLAEALNLSRPQIEEILATDHGLATVCRGLGLSRTVFSTLAMLMNGPADARQCYARLDCYDAVMAGDASRILQIARYGSATAAA